MVESVMAEKKRKQMEAIAEDLFNNEKVRNVWYSNKTQITEGHALKVTLSSYRGGGVASLVLSVGFLLKFSQGNLLLTSYFL